MLLFLGSCSSIERPKISGLNTALHIFRENGGRNIQIPKIQYAHMESYSAGYYNRIEDVIYINSTVWPYLDIVTQELILLHEFGHGALRRSHLNDVKFKDGCPESIMLYNIEKVCYLRYKSYYLNELFEDKGNFYTTKRK